MYSTPTTSAVSVAEEDRYNLVLNINRDVMHRSQPRQFNNNNNSARNDRINNNNSPSSASNKNININNFDLQQQQHDGSSTSTINNNNNNNNNNKYGSLQTVNSVSQLYARETQSASVNREISTIYEGLSSNNNNHHNNNQNNNNNNNTDPVFNMTRRSDEYRVWHARRQKLRPSREETELDEQLRCLADRRRRRTVMMNKMERERVVREDQDEAEKRRQKQEEEDAEHRRAIADGSYLLSKSNSGSTAKNNNGTNSGNSLPPQGQRSAAQILEARERELSSQQNRTSTFASNKPESLIYDSSTITTASKINNHNNAEEEDASQQQRQEASNNNKTNTTCAIASSLSKRKKYTFEDLSFDVKARIFGFLPVIPPYMLDDIRFICTFLPTDDALTLHEPRLAREAFDFVEECIHEHKEQYSKASMVAIVVGLSDECLQNAWRYEVGGGGTNNNNNNSSIKISSFGGNSLFTSTSAAMLSNNRLARHLKLKEIEKQNRRKRLTRKLLAKEQQRQEILQKQNQLKNISQQQQQTSHATMKRRIAEVYVKVDEMMKKLYAAEEETATLRYPPDSSPYHCSVPHQQRELYGQMISIAATELKRQRQILNLCEKWIGFERVAIDTPCSVLRLILRECLDAWSNRVVQTKNAGASTTQMLMDNDDDNDNVDEEGDALIQEHEEQEEAAQRQQQQHQQEQGDYGITTSTTKILKSPISKSSPSRGTPNNNKKSSPSRSNNNDGTFKKVIITSLPRLPQEINPSVRELLKANLDSMLRRVKAVEFVGAPTTEAEDIRDMLWDARSMHLPQGTNRDYGKTLTLGQIVSLGIAEVPWVRGFSWQDRTSCVVSRADIDITKMMAQYPELEMMRQLSLDKVVDTQKVIAEREREEKRLLREQRKHAEHERKMRVKRTATDALARRVWKVQPKNYSLVTSSKSSSAVGKDLLQEKPAPENPGVVLMQHHPFGSCEICSSIHVHQVGLKKPGSAVLGDIAVCENCYEEAYEGIPTIHKLYEWVAVRDVVDYDEKTMKFVRPNIHGEVEEDDFDENDNDDEDEDDEFNDDADE